MSYQAYLYRLDEPVTDLDDAKALLYELSHGIELAVQDAGCEWLIDLLPSWERTLNETGIVRVDNGLSGFVVEMP